MKNIKQLIIFLLILCILAPIIFNLYYLLTFGVDVPFWDQWETAIILKARHNNENWVPILFGQQNEHRFLCPRIIFQILAQLTAWNIKAEMVVSWLICLLNLWLLWLLLKQTNSKIEWLLLPISCFVFSIGQWENILWGWQISTYLVVTGILGTIYFLTKITHSNRYIFLSILLGLLASFSHNTGLLLWPLGALQIWLNKDDMPVKKKPLLIWALTGICVFILYYFNYRPYLSLKTPFYNPLAFLQFMFAVLGGGIGAGKLTISTSAGIFIFIIFILSFFLLKKIDKTYIHQYMPWFILGLFSIISSVAITMGRAEFGIEQSIASRYITLSSLLIISTIVLFVNVIKATKNILLTKEERFLVPIVSIIFFIAIIIGFLTTSLWGWRCAKNVYLFRKKAAVYLQQFEFAPDNVLKIFLHPNPNLVREWASFLKAKRLNVFRKEYAIDLRGYQGIRIPDEVCVGFIDKVQVIPFNAPNTSVLYIKGWAGDPVTKKPPKAVFVFCDGNFLGRASLGDPRPDVVHVMKNENLLTSGWEIFAPNILTAKGIHTFTARVILEMPPNSYTDITEKIKIE